MSYERKTVHQVYDREVDYLLLNKDLVTKLSKALIQASKNHKTYVPSAWRVNRITLEISHENPYGHVERYFVVEEIPDEI